MTNANERPVRQALAQWQIAFFAATAFLALPLPAFALLEARVGYEQLDANPSDLNSKLFGSSLVGNQAGFTADVIVSPPLFPIGFGVRYENLSQSGGSPGAASGGFSATLTRTSLLINRRIIDTIAYLGPILSLGISNQLAFSGTYSNVTANYTASAFTGSLGLEGGVRLGFFMVGAELGYMYAPLGDLKNSAGNSATTPAGATVSVDFSGLYGRALVGFCF